jgi:serine/threonine-protein kinase
MTPGTQLGPYEVQALVGAGGMGEVWRAFDARLARRVAVKVLPAEMSTDSERLRRLEREARAASALNHPNIVTIYDVGEKDARPYIAMELVEGKTLRVLLADGPIPVKKLLSIAAQMADGLAKAHSVGLVHRDLKPDNLMVTAEGYLKILDFGLAKLVSARTGTDDTRSPTASARTEGGVVGTLGYMSPEQAAGHDVDFRSDQFAFGAIVWEMATGRRAFEGATAAEVMAAVLRDEPEPISRAEPRLPAPLSWLVERCLSKDPADRYTSTEELARQVRDLRDHVSQSGARARSSGGALFRRRSWLKVAALSVPLAVGAGLLMHLLEDAPPARAPMRLALTFPADAIPFTENVVPVALSPDGNRLVYVARAGTGTRLALRALDQPDVRAIPGTEGAINPFFSPDGLWVGFFADGKLKKVSLNGASPLVLCDAPSGRGGAWSKKGTIVFAPALDSGLSSVPAAGGTPQVLTRPDMKSGETSHRWPSFLPDGEHVLFEGMAAKSWESSRVSVLTLKTKATKEIAAGAQSPRWVPTGHLLYAKGDSLLVAPFSPDRLAFTGPAVPLVDAPQMNLFGVLGAELTFSANGTLVYVPGPPIQHGLVWVDRSGAAEPLPLPARGYVDVALAPRGDRAVLTIAEGTSKAGLWMLDPMRGTLARFVSEGQSALPVFTSDGARVVYGAYTTHKEQDGLLWKPADGSGVAEVLSGRGIAPCIPSSASPDGRFLLVDGEGSAGNKLDVEVMTLSEPRKLTPFLNTPYNEHEGVFSPDGKWVAYVSDESGRYEVYASAFPGPGPRIQVSTEGGTEPRWPARAGELYYRNGDRMMAVSAGLSPALELGKPRVLFEGQFWSDAVHRSWDVTGDGKRFLMLKPGPAETAPSFDVVLNWFEEIRRSGK